MSPLVADRVGGKDLSTPVLPQTEPRRGPDSPIAINVSKGTGPPDPDVEADVRRRGLFTHELRNHLQTAMLVTQVMRSGSCCSRGTLETLERSLRSLRDIIDRSVSEVRLTAGIHHKERIRVADLIEGMEHSASMEALHRGVQFDIERSDRELMIDADRQLIESALSNLLQNAFKFTHPAGHVWLRITSEGGSLSIEIEDECGGLPPGAIEAMFQPFEQRGADRSGLGLGLTISRQAVEADDGRISVRDIPGKGCIFKIELPLAIDLRG